MNHNHLMKICTNLNLGTPIEPPTRVYGGLLHIIAIDLHVDNQHKQLNRSSQGIACVLTHFKPQPVDQNSLVISELNLSGC
jgi:hypothetical protein